MRAISFGKRCATSAGKTVAAQSGSSPTIERTLRRPALPSGSLSTS